MKFILRSATLLMLVLFCQLMTINIGWSQVVFDSTIDLSSGTRFKGSCCRRGAEVDLGGPARLNELVWLLSGQSSGVDNLEIEMAIYANDGVEGQPSSLLWEQTFSDLSVAPGFGSYPFSLPNIIVPSKITVVSRILSSSPIATGYGISNSTSVGDFVENWILLENGNWVNSINSTNTEAFRLSKVEDPDQVLDQFSDTPATGSALAIGDRHAQTVTVGVDGYLSQIDVQIFQSDAIASGDVVVEVFGLTPAGTPDRNALLGSALIENSLIPTQTDRGIFKYTAADFSSQNLFFNAGDQFAILPRRTDLFNWGAPPWILWTIGGSYDNGTLYRDSNGWVQESNTVGFRTFVTAVPDASGNTLGDCNQDGSVNFLDIDPFIGYLTTGAYLEEADIDRSGEVTFLDIPLLIEILAR